MRNFLEICKVSHDWTIKKFYKELEAVLKEKIGEKKVFLFVSGGVDSTVAFALLSKILGKDRVRGLFVNTGLLRKDESILVKNSLEALGTNLTVLEAGETFLKNLENVFEPEAKREIIGNTFLEVQKVFFKKRKTGRRLDFSSRNDLSRYHRNGRY